MTVPYAGFCLAADAMPEVFAADYAGSFFATKIVRLSPKGNAVRADPPDGTLSLLDLPHALSSLDTGCPASFPR